MLDKEAEHWDQVARGWSRKSYANELLAEHKRKTYLRLISRWADVANSQLILKTDLFAEAFGPEQFLFDLAPINNNIVAIDVSREIVAQAKSQARRYGVNPGKYLCCDVKHLPFRSNSFDLIISDSTLDHFPCETDIITALKELTQAVEKQTKVMEIQTNAVETQTKTITGLVDIFKPKEATNSSDSVQKNNDS